jgi:hypothetical protein
MEPQTGIYGQIQEIAILPVCPPWCNDQAGDSQHCILQKVSKEKKTPNKVGHLRLPSFSISFD